MTEGIETTVQENAAASTEAKAENNLLGDETTTTPSDVGEEKSTADQLIEAESKMSGKKRTGGPKKLHKKIDLKSRMHSKVVFQNTYNLE